MTSRKSTASSESEHQSICCDRQTLLFIVLLLRLKSLAIGCVLDIQTTHNRNKKMLQILTRI